MSIKTIKGQFPEDYIRIRQQVVNERGWNQGNFSRKWKSWDEEGIDVAERERRIANSALGYSKEVARELRGKSAFCPDESNPLSHIYTKLLILLYDNEDLKIGLQQRYRVFKKFWDECVERQLDEEQIIKEFNSRLIENQYPKELNLLIEKYQSIMSSNGFTTSTIRSVNGVARKFFREGFSFSDIEQKFIKRGYDKPQKRTRKIISEEGKQVIEWAFQVALDNYWWSVDSSELDASYKGSIRGVYHRARDIDHFRKRFLNSKFGRPNWDHPGILEKYLDDTESLWLPIIQKLPDNVVSDKKAANAVISQLTEATGHKRLALYIFKQIEEELSSDHALTIEKEVA